MNRGIALAWLAGLAILSYEQVRVYRKPPVPGRLLGASGVFAGLALVAEYPAATSAATLAAWGFDLAVLFMAVRKPQGKPLSQPAAGGPAHTQEPS